MFNTCKSESRDTYHRLASVLSTHLIFLMSSTDCSKNKTVPCPSPRLGPGLGYWLRHN